MAESSKRPRSGSKIKLKAATLSIPWYNLARLPRSTLFEIQGDKVTGIIISSIYYKVVNNVVSKQSSEKPSHTQQVKLNAAIKVVDKTISLSSIKFGPIAQEASDPPAKKTKEGKDEEQRTMEKEDRNVAKKPLTEEQTAMAKEDRDVESKRRATGPAEEPPAKKQKDTEEQPEMDVEGDETANAKEEETGEINEDKQEDLPAQGSKPPMEDTPPPSSSGRAPTLAEQDSWKNYRTFQLLLDDARGSGNVESIRALIPEVNTFREAYEEAVRQANLPNQPEGLKDAQDGEEIERREEEEQAIENAKEDEKKVEENQDNPVTDFAMGEANQTVTTDVRTQHENTATIAHNVDVKTTQDVSSHIPGQVNEVPEVTDTELENPDGVILSGQVQQSDELVQDEHAAKGNDNINDVVITEAPPTTTQELEMSNLEPTEEENKAVDTLVENLVNTELVDQHQLAVNNILNTRNQTGRLRPVPSNITGASEEEIKTAEQQMKDLGREIPGFEEHLRSLRQAGIIQSVLDPAIRKRELDALRQLNKISDVSTAAMLTPEQIQAVVDKDALEKHRLKFAESQAPGRNELGTPIFSPDSARSHLHEAQRTVVEHMTQKEADEIRTNIKPFWDEYKLVRLNQGVAEMSTMPTRIIKSDRSTLKAASKIREDISQRENSFGHFMFYLLHHKFDIKGTTWGDLLRISASLGYNDLTVAQINWLITGNPNGDLHDGVDFSRIEDEGTTTGALSERINITPKYSIARMESESLHEQVRANTEPQTPYPARSMSPSAGSIDHSIHPDGSTSLERQQQSTLRGLPSSVFNIPDPRFSKRGGEEIENVREITVRNEKWSPNQKAKEGEKGYEPKFITTKVPDIGVGAKDIQAEVNQASADRLLNSLPFKLYAPIHPQACDRYLGVRNYKRLNVENSQYMKEFSLHPFNETNIPEMYTWNSYVMGLYGPVLYAFVNDISMQRTEPVFDPSTPDSVVDEYKELNELVKELTRFQEKAEDRADRVNGGAQEERPLEKEIGKLFRDSAELDKQKLARANAMIISFPDDEFPSDGPPPINPVDPNSGGLEPGPVIPDDRPLPPPDPSDPQVRTSLDAFQSHGVSINGIKNTSHPLVGPIEMNNGIVRAESSHTTLHNAVSRQTLRREPSRPFPSSGVDIAESDKRLRMFHAFRRR